MIAAILAVILATTAWSVSFSQPVLLVRVWEISLEPALLPITWDRESCEQIKNILTMNKNIFTALPALLH